MTLRILKENRGSIVKRADELIRTAIAEKRDLSGDENLKISQMKGEIFQLDQQIARGESELNSLVNSQRGSDIASNLHGYSLTRAIRMAGAGQLDGLELEASQEIARRSGINPNGFFIPNALLAETRGMSVTGGTTGQYGGNAVGTEVRGFLEALRPLSKIIQAGATLFDGLTSNISIPKLSASSTAAWKAETAELTESVPTVEQVELSPKRVGSFVELSNQLLIQSTPDIENFIRRDLLSACASALDAAAISGAGGTSPTGILATAGIGSVVGGTNGAVPDWADIVALVSAVATANADFGQLAFMTNSKVIGKLRSTAKVTSTDSQMILEGERLLNYLIHSSNNVPSNLTKGSANAVCSAMIFGNFEDVVLASFGAGTDIIVDRFSKATSGITRLVANSYCDVAIRRAESFAAMADILTTA